jgi:hypothetical protein
MSEPTCKDRINEEFKSRMTNIKSLWEDYKNPDSEDTDSFPEYHLCFDYIAPGTWKNQRKGYFRYQLSWGGPSDEFRFYIDEELNLYKIEYWFMDWFDGASKKLSSGDNFDTMAEIFDWFKDMGAVTSQLDD